MMTPYQALTSNKPRYGLKSYLPDAFISRIPSGIEEEELQKLTEIVPEPVLNNTVSLAEDSAQDDPISEDPECEREPHPHS